ncbi:MAG: alanine dehydrogenase [Acidobacteria bacterium]|nr:alanine dehydrogenase [Acidobacteriota bacterium]
MTIGVPREVKSGETRVALVPAGVRALVRDGHSVVVEAGAGALSGIADVDYREAGATLAGADDVFRAAHMIVKVKEPQESEYPRFHKELILFTYLHLAPLPQLTHALVDSGVAAIAYETIEDAHGGLPLLTPMSEVAGRLSIQVGAYHLQKSYGGSGVLLAGVPGVPPGEVAIIGGGTVGINAAKMALGMGARVTILETSARRMQYLDDIFGGRVTTLASNRSHIADALSKADLVIGAVLVTGERAPRLVERDMLPRMKRGAVIVDVAVDQGGCVETTRPTTHAEPVFEVDGVIHYCVANMPAAVPRTSTYALTNATLPYVLRLAKHGLEGALRSDASLRKGANVFKGKITCRAVAESQGRPSATVESLL